MVGASLLGLPKKGPRSEHLYEKLQGYLTFATFPTYYPPCRAAGYAGHCPTYKFRVGVSPEQGLHQFHKEKREDTFHYGKKLTQADERFRRTQPFSPDNYDYKRPCVGGIRGIEIQRFGNAISRDREKIRDYHGKLKLDPYFQTPVPNKELYRPYIPFKAYYLHHNLWPDTEMTDSGWAYGDRHLRHYHGEKDERGVVLHSYIKKRKPTFDPPWLQAGLGLRDKKEYA